MHEIEELPDFRYEMQLLFDDVFMLSLKEYRFRTPLH